MLGQGSCVRHKQSISGLFGGFEVPRKNPNLGASFVFDKFWKPPQMHYPKGRLVSHPRTLKPCHLHTLNGMRETPRARCETFATIYSPLFSGQSPAAEASTLRSGTAR